MGLIGPFSELPQNLSTNESAKFELDNNGYVRIRTSATGNFTFSGLSTALKNTTMLITDVTVEAPPSPLTNRNSLTIFNLSTDKTIFIGNSDVIADTPSTFPNFTWGQEIPPRSFWNVDITNNIAVYLRCKTGESAYVKITEYA